MEKIKINNRIISEKREPFIVAEMSGNHNLSLSVTSDSHGEITYTFNNKDNILDEYNRRIEREKRKFNRLEIKYNYELHTSKQLQDTIIILQDDISKKEGDDTISQLRSSIKMKEREYMKSSKRSDNMYYGLFTYMIYSMLYQIYGSIIMAIIAFYFELYKFKKYPLKRIIIIII